jgi:formyl-CoA transferase/CoA:oxalate CoA-transferase
MTQSALPLDGIRVLDASRVLAGPYATMLLADLGADVVKLEPPSGDESRAWGPPWWGDVADRRSAYFAAVNRNKRSIVVDLRTAEGRTLLDLLAASADLAFHNHRPSVARRLGLDALAERHSQLTVVSVAGFPGGRAERDRPAYDLLAQAVSGWMAVTGEPGRSPVRTGVAVLDLLAGMEAAIGALAALVARGARLRSVEVGLIETGVSSLVNVLGNLLASGVEPGRHGSAHPNIVPYQAFAARDGHLIVAVGNDAQFDALLGVLGLADREGRFATNAQRVERRGELLALLEPAIGRLARDPLVERLVAVGVPAGPVRSVGEAVRAMEAAHAGGWIHELDGIRLAPSPVLVDGDRLPIRRAPPRVGEHTDEVLRELGLARGEVDRLRAAGVLG